MVVKPKNILPQFPDQKRALSARRARWARWAVQVGVCLSSAGLVLLLFTFGPLLLAELKFWVVPQKQEVRVVPTTAQGILRTTSESVITPVDDHFSVIIPKIHANAPIIANVDPYNSQEYQQQLSQGVAHAKGTVLPGEAGDSFLFAHSSGDLLMARRYNSVFYLLNKLIPGDEIFIVRDSQTYRFVVETSLVVEPSAVEYLHETSSEQTLTLMTCTPAGTTQQRLIVKARLQPVAE